MYSLLIFALCILQQNIIVTVIFNTFVSILLSSNLHTGVINGLLTNITILEYSEFNCIFTFTSEFYTFVFFLCHTFICFHVIYYHPFISAWRTPSNISYKTSLVVMKSFSFCLFEKCFFSTLILKGNFAR